MTAILKTGKLLYFSKGSSCRHEIWYDDKRWSYLRYRPLKFRICRNPTWRTATICKPLNCSISAIGWLLTRKIWQYGMMTTMAT